MKQSQGLMSRDTNPERDILDIISSTAVPSDSVTEVVTTKQLIFCFDEGKSGLRRNENRPNEAGSSSYLQRELYKPGKFAVKKML